MTHISARKIRSILESGEFLEKLDTVIERTIEEKKEFGFGVYKKHGDAKFHYTEIVRGTEERGGDPGYELGANLGGAIILDLHSHPNGEEMASLSDFMMLRLARDYLLLRAQTHTHPIGIIATHDEEMDNCVLSLYQEKDFSIPTTTLGKWASWLDDRGLIMDWCEENMAVYKNYKQGLIIYDKEKRTYGRCGRSWFPPIEEPMDIEKLLLDFEHCIVKDASVNESSLNL